MQLGKISANDIRLLLQLLPRLEQEAVEARDILISRRRELFSEDCISPTWCHLYERPVLEHFSLAVIAFGQEDVVRAMAKAPNQFAELQSFVDSLDSDTSEFTADEKEEIRPQLGLIFGVATSLIRSMHCLMAYGCYLNDLIALVRSGGKRGDSALLKAVRIDPTVIGTPSVLRRVSQATLEDDEPFLVKIKGAINGGLSKQAQANNHKIRLVLQVLQELGASKLSDEELHRLFVRELKLYSTTAKADIGDAAKGIRAIQQRMRKAKATT